MKNVFGQNRRWIIGASIGLTLVTPLAIMAGCNEVATSAKPELKIVPSGKYIGTSFLNDDSWVNEQRDLRLDGYTAENIGEIESYAFKVASFTKLYLPNVTRIGGGAFMNNKMLTSIDLPVCTWINTQAFLDSPLTYINVPKLTFGNGWPFYSTVNARTTNVILPNIFNKNTKLIELFGWGTDENSAGRYDKITFRWVDASGKFTGEATDLSLVKLTPPPAENSNSR